MDRTDSELIDDYCRGSLEGLAALIHRHVDLVYAVALRRTGDPGMADDVTQAVFIVLARKARLLRSHPTVAGWLIVVTRHVARAAVRARARRVRHEHAAARPEVIAMNDHHAELAGLLDDALARLRSEDRDAIALRYLQSLSFADVGHALGITEEAARKRVSRGIERLRESFAQRGTGLNISEFTAALGAFAAPPAPAATVAKLLTWPQVAPSSSAISLSKGVLRMFAFKQYAMLSAVVLLVLSLIAGVAVLAQSTPGRPSAIIPTAVAPTPANAAAPALVISTVALQMPARNVEANIAFFEKVGFRLRSAAKPDAAGRLSWATVDSGGLRIRMVRVDVAPRPANSLIPYFWVDGGRPALTVLRNNIARRGLSVGPVDKSGPTLISFDIITPEGYTIGFYTQPL
jgi:RNA polymerase sigma factor (sigma-70 family)